MVSSSSQSVVDLTDLNIGQSISSDYVELLQTRPIIEGVIREQNLDYTYRELLDMLSISVINNTRIIKIDATSADKKEAMTIANALAEKGVSELPKLMETPEPHIAEYAIVPVSKSAPSLSRNTMIGALLVATLENGLTICAVPFYILPAVKGAVLALALIAAYATKKEQ
jgi:capsular polysaccharide biosynthesis protein